MWFYITGALLLLVAAVYTFIVVFSHQPRDATESELYYYTNDGTGKPHLLPPRITSSNEKLANGNIDDIEVSVVVPCYNETKRLGVMLEETIEHLEQNFKSKYEVLIVDDGSSDGTSEYAIEKANELKVKPHTFRVIKLSKNRGKGGAVTHGLLHIRGKVGLFADADGATKFSDIDKMIPIFENNDEPKIAIGSRAHMVNTDAVVKRSFIRNFLMYGLHTLVYVFGIRDVKDTQCGFKMFNRLAISKIFPHMHTERWIFDVEVLLLGEIQSIKIKEIAVNWEEVDGSKVDLVKDSIAMAIDMVVTRLAYLIGIYRLNECGRSDKKKQ